MANLRTGVSIKQSTPNFPKKQKFLTPWYAHTRLRHWCFPVNFEKSLEHLFHRTRPGNCFLRRFQFYSCNFWKFFCCNLLFHFHTADGARHVSSVLLLKLASGSCQKECTLFCKQDIYKQHQPEIDKKIGKSWAAPWGWLFVNYSHSSSMFFITMLVAIEKKSVQKNNCACSHYQIFWFIIMKMKVKMKNRSHR